jgi:hypothetical protein
MKRGHRKSRSLLPSLVLGVEVTSGRALFLLAAADSEVHIDKAVWAGLVPVLSGEGISLRMPLPILTLR